MDTLKLMLWFITKRLEYIYLNHWIGWKFFFFHLIVIELAFLCEIFAGQEQFWNGFMKFVFLYVKINWPDKNYW